MPDPRTPDEIAKLDPHELQNLILQRDDLVERMEALIAERDDALAKAAERKLALDDAVNALAQANAEHAQVLKIAGGIEAVQAMQKQQRREELMNVKIRADDELAKLE